MIAQRRVVRHGEAVELLLGSRELGAQVGGGLGLAQVAVDDHEGDLRLEAVDLVHRLAQLRAGAGEVGDREVRVVEDDEAERGAGRRDVGTEGAGRRGEEPRRGARRGAERAAGRCASGAAEIETSHSGPPRWPRIRPRLCR